MKIVSKKFSTTVYVGFIIFATYCVLQLQGWPMLKIWNIYGGGNFADLHLVLEWAKCYQNSPTDIYGANSPCPGYIYGEPLLYVFSLFGISVSGTKVIGFILMFFFSFTISSILPTETFKNKICALFILMSPPVLLLIERGNIDILIFVLILTGTYIWTKNYHALALSLITFTALFKFYTIPIYLLLYILEANKKTRLKILIFSVPTTLYCIWNLSIIQSNYPGGFSRKFGAGIWTDYFEYFTGTQISQPLRLLIGFLVFSLCFMLLKKISFSLVENSKFQENESNHLQVLFYVLITVHLACFAAGLNFDYRLIYLIGTFFIFMLIEKNTNIGMAHSIILGLMLIAVWLSYPIEFLQPIGDLATELLTCYFVIYALRNIRHLRTEKRFAL